MAPQTLPDEMWSRIKAASGLPDEARERVAAAINGYQRPRDKAAEGEARKKIKRAIRTTQKLSQDLEWLEQDEAFRSFGVKGSLDLAPLLEARVQLAALSKSLLNHQNRFKKRGRSRSMMIPSALVTDLLEIRTDILGVDVPTSLRETTNTGRYRKYVEMCLLFFEQSLTPKEIDRAINGACEGFKLTQSFEPANFPKSQRPPVK